VVRSCLKIRSILFALPLTKCLNLKPPPPVAKWLLDAQDSKATRPTLAFTVSPDSKSTSWRGHTPGAPRGSSLPLPSIVFLKPVLDGEDGGIRLS
jgi:hypothetical protein